MNKIKLLPIILLILIALAVSVTATTIKLQTGGTENKDDSRLDESIPDTVQGTLTDFGVTDGATRLDGAITFNITRIPAGETVQAATLWIHVSTNEVDFTIDMYHIFGNVTWNEEEVTWNNQPCGTTINNGAQCNLTNISSVFTDTADTFFPFNATTAVIDSFNRGFDNVSFYFRGPADGAGNINRFASKENADATLHPFLNITFGEAPAAESSVFAITSLDQYDFSSLTNLTVTVSNSTSFSFNASTVNGTIVLSNLSFKFGENYDLLLKSNDTGGYFNKTFESVNITETGTFQGKLFQSIVNLVTFDTIGEEQVNSFTAATNISVNSTTNGKLLIPIKAGAFQLNITSTGFEKTVTSFSITAQQNLSLNITLGSVFTFNIVREETNTPFQVNLTNSTEINVLCPNQTIRITFNNSANQSEIVNCQFNALQLVVDYGALGSYFRTLIPPFTEKNVTFYAIDLVLGDTAIQRILTLLDLTGDFAQATLTVKRAVGGIIRNIIQQKFDISDQVNLFLVKDAFYTLSIDNGIQEIILGNLIPTEAGTQTITIPKLDFAPGETTLGENITWVYTFELPLLRLQYQDTTNRTTLVRWTINDTETIVFEATSQSNSSVTMTFNQALGNTTYLTTLFVQHPDLDNFTDRRIFYQFQGQESGAIDLEGFTQAEQIDIKKWTAVIFLAMWGLLFPRRFAGLGMVTLIGWLFIFRIIGWIQEVTPLIFGFVAFLAILAWVVEAIKKE